MAGCTQSSRSTAWPARRSRRRTSSRSAATARRSGFGTVFLSERFNIKEIATISGVAGAVTERMRIATGRDQPQHPPPDRHRVVRHDDAPPHRRSLRARARPGHGPDVRRVRSAAHHHRADGGLRRADAPPVARRGRGRPRRTGRLVAGPRARPRLLARTSRCSSARSARRACSSPDAASTRCCCTRSSPTRRCSGASAP